MRVGGPGGVGVDDGMEVRVGVAVIVGVRLGRKVAERVGVSVIEGIGVELISGMSVDNGVGEESEKDAIREGYARIRNTTARIRITTTIRLVRRNCKRLVSASG